MNFSIKVIWFFIILFYNWVYSLKSAKTLSLSSGNFWSFFLKKICTEVKIGEQLYDSQKNSFFWGTRTKITVS